ncbi:MAG: hypothetical protein ACTHMI_15455 [Mucilaginibacter sp.]
MKSFSPLLKISLERVNNKLLIISPYFPPSNAADMHRVRMSLPYFTEFGWEATVVTVDPAYSEMTKDDLLLENIPENITVVTVRALNSKWTSKLGLGSLALRSLPYYLKEVNKLLTAGTYQLIYFSTTQFPVCILGAYWKRKFGIPYVIDMQDPWHSDYYRDKPKDQRPPKYWLSHRMHKYLEPKAMRQTDGLISVSGGYITDLKRRYENLKDVPASTITFGAFPLDMETSLKHDTQFEKLLAGRFINIVYIGRGGMDMHKALTSVFVALKNGLDNEPECFRKLRLNFIGTSYARSGGCTILPLAQKIGVDKNVIEMPERISYYHTLLTLKQADAILIPGSDDEKYTASKIYPYLLNPKPLLAVFNKNSSAVSVLKECAKDAYVVTFDNNEEPPVHEIYMVLRNWANGELTPVTITPAFEKYSARNLTREQVKVFNAVLQRKESFSSGSKK